MKTVIDIPFVGSRGTLSFDMYLPDDEVKSVFLYFHGGGMKKGDKKSAAIFAPYLTDRGIAVASANYSLYPNAEFPDFICDAANAVLAVKVYMSENLNCDKLYVGGSSAGGYLSMMLCFDKTYLANVGLDNSAVAGYFHDAGQPTAHYTVLKYSGLDSKRVLIDERAPLFFVGLAEKYPPMRFVVSDNDMKNRYEQTMLMLSTLEHFEYSDYDCVLIQGKHCEYCKKYDENGDSVFGKMIFDFINSFSE